MPRRKQNESGRRGSSRSDSRKSSTGRPSPMRSTHKPDLNKRPRSFGKATKRSTDDRDHGYLNSGRSVGKRVSKSASAQGSKYDGARGRSTDQTPKKNFSQRSRFSKRPSSRTSEEGGSVSSGGFKKPFQGRRQGPPSASAPADLGRENKRGSTRERGASFGKPYKKLYRSKPQGRGAASTHKRHVSEAEGEKKSDKVRLNKFIANSGISSRREADHLIEMGLISVNGKVVSELGYKVSPRDEVRYEDKVLKAEKPVYILLNKPKGFLTTTDDPQERKTVMQIIGPTVKERIYPVGRLDRNTTGLLLLTNDGDLADKLMHPSFNVKKVYKVELDKPLTKSDFQAVVEGVRLEEGRATVDDLAIVSDDGRTVGVELHIGWNRVVRRIFEALGYEVLKLDRTAYAGLDKKELGRGQWRFLTKQEIIQLKHFK